MECSTRPGSTARRAAGLAVALMAVMLAVAACGQKPGVRDEVALDRGAAAQDDGGGAETDSATVTEPGDGGEQAGQPGDAGDAAPEPDNGVGQPGDGNGEAEGEPAESADGAASDQRADQADEPTDTTQSEEGPGSSEEADRQVRGSDRTGVTEDTVRIGAHAPVTGAAPLPAPAFEEASDLYYRWYIEQQEGDILGGRNVKVTFANDQYQPSTAAQACRQLADSHFLLFGAGGTDQIQQCARLAEQSHAPYFSAGVTEAGLRGLDWYFALSMSYKEQGELLAEYVNSAYGDRTVAAVVTDTANFDDAVEGWEAGVAQQGLDYYDTLRHPRGDTSWYTSFARELAQHDVDVVYINSAPTDYLRFAQQAAEQGFEPQFVGVGITMGLNPLLESGCPALDGGEFFSPFPGLDWARDHEPEFFEAADHYGVAANDIAFGIWAQAKQLVALFDQYEDQYGSDLTRENFRAFTARATVDGGVFPPVSYAPTDRFGADSTHLLRADCDIQEHRTIATFATSF